MSQADAFPRAQRRLESQHRAVAETVSLMLWAAMIEKRPCDRVLMAHFREHTEYGSRDRRLIMETVYHVFRWWGWLYPLAPRAFRDALNAAPASGRSHAGMPPGPGMAVGPGLLLAANLMEELEFQEMLAFWAGLCDVEAADWRPIAAEPDQRVRAACLLELLGQQRPDSIPLPDWPQLLPDWCLPEIGDPALVTRLLPWFQRRPPLWFRVQKGPIADVVTQVEAAGFHARVSDRLPGAVATANARLNLNSFPPYTAGAVEVQDLASQAIGAVCGAQPGQRWWDCCAGAGGKALLLAQGMQGKGVIVAGDIRAYKLEDLRKRARRGGFSNIQCRPWDGKPVEARKATFDGVLVDAPCSCAGTWRRNPAARWSQDLGEVFSLPTTQLDILTAAATAVKPGGVLVYATCSLFRRENQAVVEAFQQAHPEYVLEPFTNPLTGELTSGMAQFWPWDGDCDAMFAARLRRTPKAAGPVVP